MVIGKKMVKMSRFRMKKCTDFLRLRNPVMEKSPVRTGIMGREAEVPEPETGSPMVITVIGFLIEKTANPANMIA